MNLAKILFADTKTRCKGSDCNKCLADIKYY